ADTLPTAPIDKLALIRLDGDLYGSTMDALVSLYPKLSPGGFVIVDDFVLSGCRTAVHEFREREGISDPIEPIDTSSVYWRRSG
ncbi:MAG TPA: TylF/MycF/NovP-related O-methyltransferase, partial [Streptosporangiaceae bacterium]|nr:TylF/MycF/NovP-related O-methyltransferase [Streptosporangiaceae bacterium]